MTDPTVLVPGQLPGYPPQMRFVTGAALAAPPADEHLCVVVDELTLLVRVRPDGRWRIPWLSEVRSAVSGDLLPVGTLDGIPAWVARAASGAQETVTDGYGWFAWGTIVAQLDQPGAALASRAVQTMQWRRTHRFCGACATGLEDLPALAARACPACKLFVPMQQSAVVLVAIRRRGTGELLLVRHTYGLTDIWALVAGFVDTGETLEEAVRREAWEEVRLGVDDIAYFGSQPWALSGPEVLLTGFTAWCAQGANPTADGAELSNAAWFPLDALPENLPPDYSLARWMIAALAPSSVGS
jgi:NAD+ diphosphatase